MLLVVRRRRVIDQMEVQKQRPHTLEVRPVEALFGFVGDSEARRPELLEHVENRIEMLGFVIYDDEARWREDHWSSCGNTRATTAPSNASGTSASLRSGNSKCPPPSSITM